MTRLRALLAERILVLDGATGTYLQGRDLGPADFGGEAYEGCNEHLVLTRPDVVRDMHEGYLAAGADIVETNTFGGTRIPLAEYGLADKVREINATAARLAREACAKFETPDRPRFVAGSMGPGTKTISVTGGITFDEVAAAFAEQTVGLVEGGADVLFLETQQDTLNVKAALLGIDRGFADAGRVLPIVLSVSIESMGTMLAGQSIEAAYVSVAHRDLLAMGMNCATGPDFMTDHLRTLAQISRFPVSCFPNAGLPDEEGCYNETPELFVRKVERFLAEGWVNIIGGCCGTTAEHVRALVELASRYRPRTAAPVRRTVVSGIEVLPIEDDRRPVIVGERTNVIGSRKFKELVVGGDLDQAAEIGRRQVRGGAQVLDVCLANPDRDELADMTAFLDVLTRKVKVPLMLDSTDHRVLEQSLERCQGKAIINSINLEDGEERFEKVVPLIHRYGAAVVVGCIDEDKARGMAVTRERKLQIAERSYRLLTEKYGVAEEDIIFDALVFPVGTGDQNYVGAGAETVEGVRLIKEALPRTKTILGISNVSFGLPAAGREILNSVFLYHCVKAGLDLAIVNAEKLERYPSIPEEERRLAEDLIHWRGDDPVAAFAAHFRGKTAVAKRSDRSALPLDERLARYIIEGSKDGLVEDLAEKRTQAKPLEIINGPLMAGMDEVGRLFNDNELIVAEVLQSAEAMKAAVAYLEPFMEKTESATKGKVILATVKGDVHDIGKNLVEIILANNGFRVVNLGIKVPPEDLIAAFRTHRPDLIGLSGLLVKSAQQMVVTAEDLRAAGVRCPVLVGGAALSAKFTAAKIAPAYGELVCYANDAMQGLDLANKLVDGRTREAAAAEVQAAQARLREAPAPAAKRAAPAVASLIRHDQPIPTPPDLKRHVLDRFPLEEIFPYLNPAMLYGKHLGLRGNLEALLAAGDEKARRLRERVAAVENELLATGAMEARAVYKFFPAQSEGETIFLYGPDRRVVESFTFPRQSTGEGLCLADFVAPRGTGLTDYAALFAVSCGAGVRDVAERWKAEGRFLDSHIVQALAIEGAEAFAELLHRRLREMWGFPDPPEMTMSERFKARYRGVRVSFGYPACPRLEDQEKLFRVLDVEGTIGVRLTEGYMMDPEASVSALVFHHPEARYFVIPPGDLEAFERRLAAGG
ncbi:MAG: methionine synthase [Deltaproteobacteria bacterium]|nr:MAG: methionine synthase [Deltaproteobacteria bacterium]